MCPRKEMSEEAKRRRQLRTAKKVELLQHAWRQKGVSGARIRGIVKGIAVDNIINQTETAYLNAAIHHGGRLADAHGAKRKCVWDPGVLEDEDERKLARYRRTIDKQYQRHQARKAKRRGREV